MAENTIQIFGWAIHLSPIAFKIPGLGVTVYWYGIIMTLGILLAITYMLTNAKRFKIKTDPMIDVILISTIGGIIGARLYYVAFNLATYTKDPLSIFALWNGGIAIYGALIGGFLTAIFMCKWKKINTMALFDLAAIALLVGQAVGRWGNFVNQEAYGTITRLPWAMTGDKIIENLSKNGERLYFGQGVHPTFLYESLWCLIGFIALHFISKKCRKFNGQIFLMYIGWYGLGRFFIEGLRTDSLMQKIPYLGTFRVSQVVAAICVIVSVLLLTYFFLNLDKLKKAATETGEALAADDVDDTVIDEPVVVETVESKQNKKDKKIDKVVTVEDSEETVDEIEDETEVAEVEEVLKDETDEDEGTNDGDNN